MDKPPLFVAMLNSILAISVAAGLPQHRHEPLSVCSRPRPSHPCAE